MLVPQFSIRWLLGLTALAAVFALVASFAYRGDPWAIALVGAFGGLVLSFVAFAGMWVVAMGVGGVVRGLRRRQPVAESPFAMHKPAPQVIEPRETDP